jgi:hypothetical protein
MRSKAGWTLIFAVLAIGALALARGQGNQFGVAGRYQVTSVHFQVIHSNGTQMDVYTAVKTDTATGQTWQLVATQDSNGHLTQQWVRTMTD